MMESSFGYFSSSRIHGWLAVFFSVGCSLFLWYSCRGLAIAEADVDLFGGSVSTSSPIERAAFLGRLERPVKIKFGGRAS